MAFVGELAEGIGQAALAASEVVLLIAHLIGNTVGGLETDTPDVVGQAVWVFIDLVDAFLAVAAVYLGGIGGADSVALEKEHDVLDVFLLFPAFPNLLDTLLADTGHFIESLDVGLNDFDGVGAELTDDELGEFRANAFDQATAKVFLDTIDGGRHDFLKGLHDELLAVLAVYLPVAFAQQHTPHRYF